MKCRLLGRSEAADERRQLRLKHSGAAKTKTGKLGLIVPLLDTLCEMYRNPLSHPEIVQLDEDDAIEVFQSGIDVIAKMVRDVIAGGNHFHQIRRDYEFFGPGISKVAASVVERDP